MQCPMAWAPPQQSECVSKEGELCQKLFPSVVPRGRKHRESHTRAAGHGIANALQQLSREGRHGRRSVFQPHSPSSRTSWVFSRLEKHAINLRKGSPLLPGGPPPPGTPQFQQQWLLPSPHVPSLPDPTIFWFTEA